MLTLNNVATQDKYVDALQVEQDTADTITYVVANASVRAQFRPVAHHGGADMPYGDEVLLTPTANTVRNVSGARFRSAVAGQPAQVIAILTGPLDPQLAAGTPFTQTLSASGQTGAKVTQFAEVVTFEAATLLNGYTDLATLGPSITIADAGDYYVEVGFTIQTSLANNVGVLMSYAIGATPAQDTEAAWGYHHNSGAGMGISVMRRRLKTFPANTTLLAKYKALNAANELAGNRWMAVIPA